MHKAHEKTPQEREHAIFQDPRGIRGAIVKAAFVVAGSLLLGQMGLLVWNVLTHPPLPHVPSPQSARPPCEAKGVPAPVHLAGCQLLEAPAHFSQSAPVTRPQTFPAAGRPLTFAFMVNWDQQGFNSLRRHAGQIDILIPQWLYYSPSDGMLIEDDPHAREQVADLLAEAGPQVRIMPLVTNLVRGNWSVTEFSNLLADPKSRRYMIDQLIAYARTHRFLGISVDFERLPEESRPDYYLFIEQLARWLHIYRMELSVNVACDDETCDYARLARVADHVIVMAYDQHWTGGEAGPIAGVDWLKGLAPKLRERIPPENLVVAVGSYAYDWPPEGVAAVKSVEEALATAREAAVEVVSEDASANPSFQYRDAQRRLHRVWFLDAVTAFNTVATVTPSRPAGVALWRLGTEDPAVWEILGTDIAHGRETAGRLCRIEPESVLYEGKGEAVCLATRPVEGLRRLWYDEAAGLIRREQFTVLPSPYVVGGYPQNPGQVALTFDDGPDPAYTPEVLSILREANVSATFFVVGANCQWHADLLRREVAEGHEIGVHTFTHPDISRISPRRLALELSTSQRTLEVLVGRRSTLFRPPYNRDANPTSPEHLKPLEEVTDLGYVTVGMRADTEDWKNPGVDEIVSNALDQVRAGAQIVLMHDSGGDRRQTLEALPRIISELRREGHELVTVSQLLGRTRAQVMPPLSAGEQQIAASNRAAFWELRSCLALVKIIFITGLALGMLRMGLIAYGAIMQHRRARRNGHGPVPDLSVSVIVPAHNEERVVLKTVRSLLASEGLDGFEILVVDDGSTDGTYRAAVEAFAGERRVTVFSKPKGGKSSALNFGLERARGDIVVMLDADTVFETSTIRRLLAHFRDPMVGAVAGNVKVGNRVNLLTRWQALEYITSQSLDRRALTSVNSNMVVPGAVGAWRRDLVVRVGMLNRRTLAEDADLTVSVCRLGYRIEYEPDALARTEAPDNLRAFFRQRFRWMFGTFQVAAKHLSALFSRREPYLGFIGMPNVLIFQVFYPLMAPLMDVTILVSVILMGYAHWTDAPTTGTAARQFAFYYLLFLAADTLSALLAFTLERKEDWRLLLWVPFQRLFYRFTLYYIAVKSVWAALTGRAVGWGTVYRKATVSYELPEIYPGRVEG